MASSQFSRRTLAKLTLAVASGFSLASCSAESHTDSASASNSQQDSKTLRFAQAASVTSLDVATSSSLETARINAQVIEGLVAANLSTGQPEPALATDWTISDDQLTYTFTLRNDVKFHDGSTLDSETVRKNFERFEKLAHTSDLSSHAWYLTFFGTENKSEVLEPLISSYKAQGSSFIIELSRPSTSFLSALAQPAFAVCSTGIIGADGTLSSSPIGTGPFTVQSTENDTVKLSRFESYWGNEVPLDSIEFITIKSSELRFYKLTSDELDVYDQVGREDYVPLARSGYQTRTRDPYALTYVGINLEHPVFADPNVRLAVTHAVDASALVHAIFPEGSNTAVDYIPPLFMSRAEGIETLTKHDQDRAKELLKASSYSGEEVEFYYPTDVSLTSMEKPEVVYSSIAADLTRAGFTIKPVPIKWSDGYLDKVNATGTKRGLSLHGFTGSYRDPNAFIWRVLAPTLISAKALSALDSSPKVKDGTIMPFSDVIELIQKADALDDLDERREAFKDASYHLMEHTVAVPIAYAVSSVALGKNVTSYSVTSTGIDDIAHADVQK